jgi:hypothetical protein
MEILNPNWQGILPILLHLYHNPDTRRDAIRQLELMATAADKYNAAIETITLNAVADDVVHVQ